MSCWLWVSKIGYQKAGSDRREGGRLDRKRPNWCCSCFSSIASDIVFPLHVSEALVALKIKEPSTK